jgi:hypothetical protein
VLWTAARSHRTFKVMVKNCKLGYALEAAKLNRALFEDMACAHWAQQFPATAVKLIEEHEQYALVLRAEAHAKHGLEWRGPPPPTLSAEKRAELDDRYRNGSRSWPARSTATMVENIAGMWPKDYRRLLMQMHDIAHQANNVILHHSALSLKQGVIPTVHGIQLDVKPSPHGVRSALGFGFWVYANTITLVLDGSALGEVNELARRYEHLYSHVRSAGERDEVDS